MRLNFLNQDYSPGNEKADSSQSPPPSKQVSGGRFFEWIKEINENNEKAKRNFTFILNQLAPNRFGRFDDDVTGYAYLERFSSYKEAIDNYESKIKNKGILTRLWSWITGLDDQVNKVRALLKSSLSHQFGGSSFSKDGEKNFTVCSSPYEQGMINEKIYFRNGAVYEGSLLEGKEQNGVITYPPRSSEFKSIHFENGKETKIIYENGDVAEGEFKDRQLQNGILTYDYISNFDIRANRDIQSIQIKNGVESKIQYRNGNIKEGILKDRLLIEGKFINHKQQTSFEGTFVDGNLQGQGKISDLERGITLYEGRFDKGEFKEGRYTDEETGCIYEGHFIGKIGDERFRYETGKIIYPDGSIGEGKIQQGELKEGTLTSPKGEIRKGKFAGKILIEGTISHVSGEPSIVEIKVKEGKEVQVTYENGHVDAGSFIKRELQQGTRAYPQLGIIYEGEIEKGQFKIRTCTDEDSGITYEGDFLGEIFKTGIATHPNGDKDEGEFENYRLKKGTRTYSDTGLVYQGDLVDGIFDGKGAVVNPKKNLLYEGVFKNGKLEGKGTVTNLNTGLSFSYRFQKDQALEDLDLLQKFNELF